MTKKALLIGINYVGQPCKLRGCANDAFNLANFLVQYFGYSPENMRILTDDATNRAQLPSWLEDQENLKGEENPADGDSDCEDSHPSASEDQSSEDDSDKKKKKKKKSKKKDKKKKKHKKDKKKKENKRDLYDFHPSNQSQSSSTPNQVPPEQTIQSTPLGAEPEDASLYDFPAFAWSKDKNAMKDLYRKAIANEKDIEFQLMEPTKQNILDSLHWLVDKAKPGDRLFFHYSGHGTQVEDLDGDGKQKRFIYLSVSVKLTRHVHRG